MINIYYSYLVELSSISVLSILKFYIKLNFSCGSGYGIFGDLFLVHQEKSMKIPEYGHTKGHNHMITVPFSGTRDIVLSDCGHIGRLFTIFSTIYTHF